MMNNVTPAGFSLVAVDAAPKDSCCPNQAALQAVLDRFEISIAEANDLVALEDYEIVVIADDSGSMKMAAAPPDQRSLNQTSKTRWAELRETLRLVVELGACFDQSGSDIYFLNRDPVKQVQSADDYRLERALSTEPRGSTPLTETLKTVVSECGGEKPVLLFILTDGEPNGGVQRFHAELSRTVKKQSTSHTFKVQIMACTNDEGAVGWLDAIDHEFPEVDVTDDYYSEMVQVLKEAKRVKKFTRGDWCMKAMLGPISKKFDDMDERPTLLGSKPARGADLMKSNTVFLEQQCRCSGNDACVIC